MNESKGALNIEARVKASNVIFISKMSVNDCQKNNPELFCLYNLSGFDTSQYYRKSSYSLNFQNVYRKYTENISVFILLRDFAFDSKGETYSKVLNNFFYGL